MFIHSCILVSFLFYPTTNLTFGHTACVSVKWCGKATDVFIYSNVRSCLTCCQRHTDYRDLTISMVAAPHLRVCKLDTHLERAVESCHFGNLVLHHFASVWGDFFLADVRRRQWFWDINLYFPERRESFQRESQMVTLRWLVSLMWRFKRDTCDNATHITVKSHTSSK